MDPEDCPTIYDKGTMEFIKDEEKHREEYRRMNAEARKADEGLSLI